MNVLIKVELPDDAIIPDVDEITLGDENRNCKVVAVIPEPYFLQYTKGDTQVLDGCTIQLTDDSVNPITVQSPEQQKIQNKAFNLINRIDRAVTETLRMMGYPILDLKMGTVERILSEPTEQVNHPDHYNAYPIEVIDMMAEIFSVEADHGREGSRHTP